MSGRHIYGVCTYEVFGRQQNRADMVVLNQDADLIGDGGAIKAHHKQLAQLPALYTCQRGARWSLRGRRTYLDSSQISPFVAIVEEGSQPREARLVGPAVKESREGARPCSEAGVNE